MIHSDALQERQPFGVSGGFFLAAEDGGFGDAADGDPPLLGGFFDSGHDAIGDIKGDGFFEDALAGNVDAEFLGFVVWLDERDDASGGAEPFERGGDDEALHSPPEIDNDEVYAIRWRHCVEGVGALSDDDTGIVAELPCEFAVGGVDAVDLCSTGLQQAIGEAARGAAQIGTHQSGCIDGELCEGVLQFEPATRDELGRVWVHRYVRTSSPWTLRKWRGLAVSMG